jgi:hypothetical protein
MKTIATETQFEIAFNGLTKAMNKSVSPHISNGFDALK